MPTGTATTPSTELDAINTMLSCIGETPVNSLHGALPADVAIAMNTLRETVREIQFEGWHFNTENNYPLIPDSIGEITLPSTIVRVFCTDPDSNDIIVRGNKLYDKINHTYIFQETVTANIVLLLSFDNLPPTFKWYATIVAARKFQDRVVGSSELHAYTQEDEERSRYVAVREDTEIGRPSLAKGEATSFISGWSVGQTLRR